MYNILKPESVTVTVGQVASGVYEDDTVEGTFVRLADGTEIRFKNNQQGRTVTPFPQWCYGDDGILDPDTFFLRTLISDPTDLNVYIGSSYQTNNLPWDRNGNLYQFPVELTSSKTLDSNAGVESSLLRSSERCVVGINGNSGIKSCLHLNYKLESERGVSELNRFKRNEFMLYTDVTNGIMKDVSEKTYDINNAFKCFTEYESNNDVYKLNYNHFSNTLVMTANGITSDKVNIKFRPNDIIFKYKLGKYPTDPAEFAQWDSLSWEYFNIHTFFGEMVRAVPGNEISFKVLRINELGENYDTIVEIQRVLLESQNSMLHTI